MPLPLSAHATRLRRTLAARGLTPATLIPDASAGRADEAAVRVARLVEHAALETVPVGAPLPWTGAIVAFLDGVQRSEVVAYAGAQPLVLAEVAAAVRERRDRHLHTVVELRRRVLVGRYDALAAAGTEHEGIDTLVLPDDGPLHPVRDLAAAARQIDRARGNLELQAGDRYRAGSDGWLVIDGSLGVSPGWAADERMIGVVKSHATLPFEGEALERYLRLPAGTRSSVFAPAGSIAPVHAWALRLWPWEGRDLLHGLVRIEVAPQVGTTPSADRLSRHLLAERVPLSAPDPRWDRLLYGIHAVEQYLRARPAV
jgi:hypothetical protein